MAAKKNRNKQAERERAAKLRAAQQEAERKRRLTIAAATTAAVLLIIAMIVGSVWLGGKDDKPKASPAGALDATALAAINDIPASVFDEAGTADTKNAPTRVKDAQQVTKDGKPQILYVGAEYCPYCAGLRWSAAAALGRFGTWTSLSQSASVQERTVDPISTVSFSQQNHGAAYSSELLAFSGYETSTSEIKNGQYVKLDKLEGDDKTLFEKFDFPPYAEEGSAGAIPFMSIGGKTFQHGGLMDLALLEGKTSAEIATSLKDGKDPAAKAVLANANLLTAAICEQTGNQPAEVCSSKAVKDSAAKLRDK